MRQKIIDDYCLYYLNDLFRIKLFFFTIQVECRNFLNLFGCYLFGMSSFNHFLLIDATDRSKISSDQTRLFFDVNLYSILIVTFAIKTFSNIVCNTCTV